MTARSRLVALRSYIVAGFLVLAVVAANLEGAEEANPGVGTGADINQSSGGQAPSARAGASAQSAIGRGGDAAGAGSAGTTEPVGVTSASQARGPGDAALSYPGVGTPEALANPDCDPETGRIKFPNGWVPPCVVEWPKGADNGGATSMGVTADTIRVVVYLPASDTRDEQAVQRNWRLNFESYDMHYELWGRNVEVVFYEGSGSDEVAQRADAAAVALEIQPFLSTTASTYAPVYAQELASRGVINLDYTATWNEMQQQAPFRWSANADDRVIVAHLAEYLAKRLQGRPARWAGDASMREQTRALGLIHSSLWDRPFIDQQAQAQGVGFADIMQYQEGDVTGAQDRARTMVARLREAGVTTVVAGTDSIFTVILTNAATQQAYFPEWVITGWGLQDVTLFGRLYDQQQWANAFGIGPVYTLPRPENDFPLSVYRWHHGRESEDATLTGQASGILYLVYMGLTLAGPDLTPETFQHGMFSMPPTGGTYCGCVSTFGISFGSAGGFPWPDYSGWDDFNEKWWDPDQNGPDEAGLTNAGGYYMKVSGGARYALGQWPTTEPRAFDPEGAIAFFDERPESERPGPYEHHPHDEGS